jgi:CHRD domain-containing protein
MRAALVWPVLALAAVSAVAQTEQRFRARLSPVPIDLTMQTTIAGSGSAVATLNGSKLAISGTFDGLKSPATTAAIHRSPVRGVRGPAVAALTVTHGQSGTISGSMDLTPQQLTDLRNGRLYVQVHSEMARDGNLWGWLLEKR